MSDPVSVCKHGNRQFLCEICDEVLPISSELSAMTEQRNHYLNMNTMLQKECAELRNELAEFDPHRKLHALEKDCITMALRLLGDDESTFAPETIEVMNRWKPKISELLK